MLWFLAFCLADRPPDVSLLVFFELPDEKEVVLEDCCSCPVPLLLLLFALNRMLETVLAVALSTLIELAPPGEKKLFPLRRKLLSETEGAATVTPLGLTDPLEEVPEESSTLPPAAAKVLGLEEAAEGASLTCRVGATLGAAAATGAGSRVTTADSSQSSSSESLSSLLMFSRRPPPAPPAAFCEKAWYEQRAHSAVLLLTPITVGPAPPLPMTLLEGLVLRRSGRGENEGMSKEVPTEGNLLEGLASLTFSPKEREGDLGPG